MDNHTPHYLYKIVSPETWEKSVSCDTLSYLPTEDATFIHLSTEEQLPRIIQKFWSGCDYVVLKIETKKMKGRLVYEANPGRSNKYFHLYEGSIPLDAIVDVKKHISQY